MAHLIIVVVELIDVQINVEKVIKYFINFPLPVIATLMILSPVFFILFKKNNNDKKITILLIYLLLKFILLFEATHLSSLKKNTLFIHDVLILIELLFVLLFFNAEDLMKKYQKYFISISWMFSIFFIWDLFHSNSNVGNIDFRYVQYSATLLSVIIIGIICVFLYEIIKHPTIIDIYTSVSFYVSVYLLFLHCSKIFFSPLLFYNLRWDVSVDYFQYIEYIFEIFGMVWLSIFFKNYERKIKSP